MLFSFKFKFVELALHTLKWCELILYGIYYEPHWMQQMCNFNRRKKKNVFLVMRLGRRIIKIYLLGTMVWKRKSFLISFSFFYSGRWLTTLLREKSNEYQETRTSTINVTATDELFCPYQLLTIKVSWLNTSKLNLQLKNDSIIY